MATEVEILGHKAKIESVRGQPKLEPWWKEEQLVVWLSFDEAVDGTLSFATYLPVKKYERAEFLNEVRRHGEETFRRILVKHEKEKREMQERDERQKALDAVVAAAQSLIE